MYFTSVYPSPLGSVTLVCSDSALTALRLPGQKPFEQEARFLLCPESHPILRRTARWLDRYFAGERPRPSELPLAPEGTAFQNVIWKLLLEIPYGQSVTYGQLAGKAAAVLGKARMSAQAVGRAVGANPIAIIIPCHRCLGAGGRLTGYAGGLHLKQKLLDMEEIAYTE